MIVMWKKIEEPIEKQNKEIIEKDYEASFPGVRQVVKKLEGRDRNCGIQCNSNKNYS